MLSNHVYSSLLHFIKDMKFKALTVILLVLAVSAEKAKIRTLNEKNL